MKNLLLIGILSVFSAQLNAQKIFVGPEVGLNLILIEKQEVGDDYQPGIYIGGAFEYQLKEWFSIKSGVYFTQTHQSYNSADTVPFDFFGFADSSFSIPGLDLNTYSTSAGRQTQSYIQIPLLANYKWNGLNVYAGGYLGFMIGAIRKENTVSTTPFMSTIDLSSIDSTGFISSFFPKPYEETFNESSDKTNLQGVDYGLKFGIGYQIKNVGINCSYSYGIPDYRKDRGDSELKRHQYFQFSINYMIVIGKKEGVSSIK